MNENRRSSDTELALLRQDVDEIKASLKDLKDQIRELVDAWNTASGLVRFIKWLSILIAAMGVIWAFLSGYFHR